jgi:pyruvate formate lyase activating enzyme
VQSTFLKEVLSLCKSEGIHTALDTSGHANSDILQEVMELTDLFLYDLKLMNDFAHQKYTGVSNRLSLANLDTLIDRGKEIIIRFPIIPGITNDVKNIESIARFMLERNLRRIDLLPYHEMASNKYRTLGRVYELDHLKDNSAEELQGLADFFSEKGLVVSS